MVNYANGKVYKVESISGNLVFYSSTTLELSHRMAEHRAQLKRYTENQNVVMSRPQKYISVFRVLEFDDAKIILVANCNCKKNTELKAYEHDFIKKNDCVNKIYAEEKKKELRARKEKYCVLLKNRIPCNRIEKQLLRIYKEKEARELKQKK